MNEKEREKLERNLYKGLEEEGKTISKSSMKKVVEILGEFDDFTGRVRGWQKFGFSFLYLRGANLNAEWNQLSKIIKIDSEVGWFMGREKLEEWIFLSKALKIINNQEVK